MNTPNSNTTIPEGDDEPYTQDFNSSIIILVTPFIAIPLWIVFLRLLKFSYKYFIAKKYGTEKELLSDPLVALGFKKKKPKVKHISKKKSRMEKMEIYEDMHHRQEHSFSTWKLKLLNFYKVYLSPRALQDLITQTRFGRIWMVLQVFFTLLAIINYILLTYLARKEDRNDRKLVKTLDLAYAGIFLTDYIISMYTAEDSLKFFFQLSTLIDLVSIITPFVVISNVPGQYVWFLGLLRIFKATRINRTYKILSFSESEETRELTLFILNMINFMFFSASIINATESLVEAYKSPPTLLNWHDSLYYIMVTFSTIGFGDLTPTSTISRFVVMILIILILVYIPMQTSKIAELYNSMSIYQRADYKASKLHSHVVISGSLTFNAVIDFCREYFASDPNGHILLVDKEEPTMELRRLMNHPFYRGKVNYLRGDITTVRDLKRVKSNCSSGLFLLNSKLIKVDSNQDTKAVRDIDTSILMQSLIVKNLEPGIPIFVEIQDSGSLEIAESCGCDRILSLQDIKINLIARTCLVPGLLPLIVNLINTYPNTMEEDSLEFWKGEYHSGVNNQIQSFRIPFGLVGVPFHVASKILYREFGAVLFALMSATAGISTNEVRLNPGSDYKLREMDIGLLICDPQELIVYQILFEFKEKFDWKQEWEQREENRISNAPYSLDEEEIILKSSEQNNEYDNLFNETHEIALSTISLNVIQEQVYQSQTFSKGCPCIPKGLHSHIIVCGYNSLQNLLLFVNTIRNSAIDPLHAMSGTNAHQDTPIVIILEEPLEESLLLTRLIEHKYVYFVFGKPRELKTLRDAQIDKCKRIVVFADQSFDDVSAVDSNSVLLIKVIKKNWSRIAFLVEMLDGSTVKYFSKQDYEWNARHLKMQTVLNNYEIQVQERISKFLDIRHDTGQNTSMLSKTIRFLLGEPSIPGSSVSQPRKSFKQMDQNTFEPLLDNEDEDIKAELIQKEVADKQGDASFSAQYFQKMLEQVETTESGLSPSPVYYTDKHFASGMISISSSLHSLLCQSYFRPYIIDVMKALLSNLIQIKIPHSWSGREYGEYFNFCMDRGYILVGLYRYGAKEDSLDLPFVYTNCQEHTIIYKTDLIFAIKNLQ